MELNEVLYWLLNSGGSITVVSWLLERWAWYQEQDANKKEMVFFVLSALVSLVAMAIINFVPAEVLAQIAPVFQAIYGVFATVYLGKAFHKFDTSLTKKE